MSYKFLSIDESTRATGMALFKDGVLYDYALIDLSKDKDSEHRLNEMCRCILEQLKKFKPNSIVIEHPQGYGSNVLVVNKLSEIIGVVRAYAIEKNCEFAEVSPSEWRSYIGFKQGTKKRDELKKMSIDYVKQKYNIFTTDDLADAICIGEAMIKKYDKKEK